MILRVLSSWAGLAFWLICLLNIPARAQYHAVLVQQDGSLWAWGDNQAGQLGDGTTFNRVTPVPVAPGTKWRMADAGKLYTVALQQDGSLWAWGENRSGQLGEGTFTTRSQPVVIAPGTTWNTISAGTNHTLAIRQDGTLWAWGSNMFGCLGNGSTVAQATPIQILPGTTWRSVSAGEYHSVAISTDGAVWTWGCNTNGALGDGTRTHRSTPYKLGGKMQSVSAGPGYVISIDQNGQAWNWGDYSPLGSVYPNIRPAEFVSTFKWRSVSAGYQHCALLKDDGTLWTASNNSFGSKGSSLGIGDNPNVRPNAVLPGTTWQDVSAGTFCNVAVQMDGSIWTWGENYAGALGTTTIGTTRLTVPHLVGYPTIRWQTPAGGRYYSVAIDQRGHLWRFGEQNYLGANLNQYNTYALSKIDSINLWTQVWTNPTNKYLLGIQKDGSLWSQGQAPGRYANDSYDRTSNSYQKLVPVVTGTTWQMVAPGPQCAWGIQQNGTLWGWGGNIGLFYSAPVVGDGTTAPRNEPVQLAPGSRWRQVSASLIDHYASLPDNGYYAAAIRADSTLWMWGYNAKGQLGFGDKILRLTPEQVKPGSKWRMVSTGANHTAAIAQDGTLWAWGSNEFGQLGNGSLVNAETPIPIAAGRSWQSVRAGISFTVALDRQGKLWTWGYNGYGELGNGSTTQNLSPQLIMPTATWQDVQVGPLHVLAIRDDGTLWTWGANDYGQAGHSYYSNVPLRIGSLSHPLATTVPSTPAADVPLTVWPVPFGGAGVQVQLRPWQRGPFIISLLNATGRVLWQQTLQVPATTTLTMPQAGALPSGVYLLRLQQGKQQSVLRIIRE